MALRRGYVDTVVRWACVDASGVETSVPRGWLVDDPRLRDYIRAAGDAEEGRLSFYWAGQGGRLSRVDLAVITLPSATRRQVEASLTSVQAPYGLTFRELEVLTLVAGGLTNPTIAERLGTTRRTVATHIERLLGKLNAPTRTAAAALAVDEQLLVLPIPGGPKGLAPMRVQQLEVAACASEAQPAPRRSSRHRPPHKHPMMIGGIYPVRGPAAADGQGRRKATEMAIDEINKSGGIAGRALVHVPVESDIADLASLTGNLDALIEHGVDAVTFGYTLARDDFATVFAKAADYGCPVLHSATSASAQRLVIEEPTSFGNVFQVCAPESRYGTGFVRTLNELSASGAWSPHNRRLLVVDSDDPHLTTFTSQAFDIAERFGWKITVERIDFLHPDWDPVFARLGEVEPAAIMVATWVEHGLLDFLRDFRAAAIPSLVYAIYAPSVPGFVQRAGPLAEGLLWATVIGLYQDTLAGEFARDFSGAHPSEPGRSGAGIHYDMVHVLSEAWRQVTSPHDFSAVTQRMRRLVHRGVSGAYYFGTPGQSALAYPDDTLDASIAQAHLVHQIQSGRHMIVAPAPYATGTFRPPPWLPEHHGQGPARDPGMVV